MSEFLYFPFDEGEGAFLTEDRWTQFFIWMRTVGILSVDLVLSSDGDLSVNPADPSVGTQIQIENGEAYIQGFYFSQTDGPEVIDIELNESGDPRIDLVVLRLDKDENAVYYVVLNGTPDPAPEPPEPFQNSTYWDLPLAEVYVADEATEILPEDITDVRVRSMQGDGGSSAVSLESTGGDVSLVVDGEGPDISIAGLSPGDNMEVELVEGEDGTYVLFNATGAGSDVTLSSGTGDETLVKEGTGPDLETKALSEGTGITLSSDTEEVTIATNTTISNGTADEELVTGSNPAFTVKGITAGANISLTSDANSVTVTGANTPSDQPICIIRRNANLTVANGATTKITWTTAIYDPYSMWDSGVTAQQIIVPEDGYYRVDVNLTWGGDASANGTVRAVIDRPSIRVAECRSMMVGDEDISNNFSGIYTMSAGDDFDVSVNNLSGVSLDVLSTVVYTPTFAVYKIRSA